MRSEAQTSWNRMSAPHAPPAMPSDTPSSAAISSRSACSIMARAVASAFAVRGKRIFSGGRSGLSIICPVKSTTRDNRSCAAGIFPVAANASSMTPSAVVTLSASKPSDSKISMFRRAAETAKGSFLTRASALLYSFSTRAGLSMVRNRTSARAIAGHGSPSSCLTLKTGSIPKVRLRAAAIRFAQASRSLSALCGLVGIVEGRFPRIGRSAARDRPES